MAILNRQQIIGKRKVITKSINVPEWEGDILIKMLTVKDREVYEEAVQKNRKGDSISTKGLRSLLCVLACVNEDLTPMFPAKEDVEVLSEMSGDIIDRLASEIAKFNGLAADSKKELEGN